MDPILFWNDVALEANRVSHTDPEKRDQNGPTLSSRALAIVHLAMYDAYAGVKNTPASLPPYLTGLPAAPAGASAAAAVAAAAHATLSFLYKKQKPFFDLKHTQAGLTGTHVGVPLWAEMRQRPCVLRRLVLKTISRLSLVQASPATRLFSTVSCRSAPPPIEMTQKPPASHPVKSAGWYLSWLAPA